MLSNPLEAIHAVIRQNRDKRLKRQAQQACNEMARRDALIRWVRSGGAIVHSHDQGETFVTLDGFEALTLVLAPGPISFYTRSVD